MNSIVENLLKEMEKCNSKNNRCDYLLEHSEIDYLLEYIDQLQQENQKHKEIIDKANKKLTTMFANGDDDKILDDLLELCKNHLLKFF